MDIISSQILSLVNRSNSSILLVGIAGIPGSGKSTLASTLIQEWESHKPPRISGLTLLVMDGYHIPLAHLPASLIPRRGCPESFAPENLLSLLTHIRESKQGLIAPSFDHSVGDPIYNIPITYHPWKSNDRKTHVFLIEGLYLALDAPVWKDIHSILDQIYFLEISRDVSRSRVISRHIQSGLSQDEHSAAQRYDSNDALNADIILSHRLPATLVRMSNDV